MNGAAGMAEIETMYEPDSMVSHVLINNLPTSASKYTIHSDIVQH